MLIVDCSLLRITKNLNSCGLKKKAQYTMKYCNLTLFEVLLRFSELLSGIMRVVNAMLKIIIWPSSDSDNAFFLINRAINLEEKQHK